MDKKIVDQYLAEVPYQVRLAVKPLSNDKSWAILIALLKDGDMRFADIKRKFRANSSGDIDRILKQLIQSGLISKKAMNYDEIFDNTKSIYSATSIGASVVHSLNRALSPSFNYDLINKMQTQKIPFQPGLRLNIPDTLNKSVQAQTPQSYKFVNLSPSGFRENIATKLTKELCLV